MSNVTVKFNKQDYHLACKDGEGERLTKLAQYVDDKASQIARSMGSITDTRLLLMTAIILADELDEARGGKPLEMSGAQEKAGQLEKTLSHTIKRIEEITRHVEAGG